MCLKVHVILFSTVNKEVNLIQRVMSAFFLGYSIKIGAYWVFNELIKSMMVSINVIINDDQNEVIHDEDKDPGLTSQNDELEDHMENNL